MGDWILRAEGVNFDDTVFNTNDLSTVRGSSLTLEAFVHALEHVWLKSTGEKYARVYYGGSQVAFQFHDVSEAQAVKLAEEAREYLTASCTFPPDWPPYFDYANNPQNPPDKAWASQNLNPPTEHMRFIVEVTPVDGDVRAAVNRAMWKSRRRQMLAPNLPIAPGATAGSNAVKDRVAEQCPIDPAQTLDQDTTAEDSVTWIADGQFRNVRKTNNKRNTPKVFQIYASKRSADLRTYGRDARRMLYPVQLEENQVKQLVKNGLFRWRDFAQSFHQIVGEPPKDLPESVKGKLAYLHFDGNSFGAIRAESDLGKFAQAVEAVNRHVLNALLKEFLPCPDPDADHRARMFFKGNVFVREAGKGRHKGEVRERELLRMETLLFGGEDFVVVLPAWLGWAFADKILGWYAQGVKDHAGGLKGKMTHRCGMLICDQKTPVRRARDMAYALCEGAKKAYEGKEAQAAVAFHIIESHDVPEPTGDAEMDIAAHRLTLFSGPEGADAEWVPHAFSLLKSDRDKLHDALICLKPDMARSRLYRLIGELGGDDPDLSAILADYSTKGRTGLTASVLEGLLGSGKNPDVPMRLHLKVLAELWDYVEPFAGEAS